MLRRGSGSRPDGTKGEQLRPAPLGARRRPHCSRRPGEPGADLQGSGGARSGPSSGVTPRAGRRSAPRSERDSYDGGRTTRAAWWSGRVAGGHVWLPANIIRPDIAEMCASEGVDRGNGSG